LCLEVVDKEAGPIVANEHGGTLTVTTTDYPIDIESVDHFEIRDQYEANHSIFDPGNWKEIR
jgi:hypothetical protein